MTWEELLKIIRDYGFANDEYFDWVVGADWGIMRKSPIWSSITRRVLTYWHVGANEGFYVYVNWLSEKEPEYNTGLIGKFWDWQRAQEAVNFIQYVVNFGKIPADAKLPEQE